MGGKIPGPLTWRVLRRHAAPDERLIRQALSGNICRCTGYAQIVDAVLGVVQGKAAAE